MVSKKACVYIYIYIYITCICLDPRYKSLSLCQAPFEKARERGVIVCILVVGHVSGVGVPYTRNYSLALVLDHLHSETANLVSSLS